MTPDEKFAHNERTKLSATWLNTIGAAAIALGALTPTALVISSFERGQPVEWALLWGVAIWVPSGLSLHMTARYVLGMLRS